MKPDAVYIFDKLPDALTVYKLVSNQGADIPNFPAVWKVNSPSGGKKGEKYVVFRDRKENMPGHTKYTHAITMAGNSMVSSFNLTPDFPRKAYGDYGGDGLLIEFSQDWKRLYMWFFHGQKEAKQSLFQSWQEGEIPDATPDNAMPLETKKAG